AQEILAVQVCANVADGCFESFFSREAIDSSAREISEGLGRRFFENIVNAAGYRRNHVQPVSVFLFHSARIIHRACTACNMGQGFWRNSAVRRSRIIGFLKESSEQLRNV